MPHAGSSLPSLLFLFTCIWLVASAPVPDQLGSLTSLSGPFGPYNKHASLVRSGGYSVKGSGRSARQLSDVGYEPIFPRSPKGKQAAPKAAPKAAAPKSAPKPAAKAAPKRAAPKAAPKPAARKAAAAKPQQAKAQGPAKPHLSVGQRIKAHFQRVGQSIKHAFQKFGQKVKTGFQKFGQKVKAGFQTFARKAKAGFQKVGHWFKETGKKIVKVALKVVAVVGGVLSHVARFIPVIGQPISAALKLHSEAMNKASDSIHANLGKKLDKAMHVMDIVRDPLGAAAGAAAGAVQKKIQSHHK